MSPRRRIGTHIAGPWLVLQIATFQPNLCLCAPPQPRPSLDLVVATPRPKFEHEDQVASETDTALPLSRSTSQVESGSSASFENTVSEPSHPDRTTKTNLEWEPAARPLASKRANGTINASLADEGLGRWNIGGNGDATYISNHRNYHPGTRVIVEIGSLGLPRREVPKSSIIWQYLAEFRNRGYWPYRTCFEATARDIPSKGGDTWIGVQVNARGRGVSSRFLKSNINRPQIADCIVRATRLISLRRPPQRWANFTLLVRVFAGDAPLTASTSIDAKSSTIDQHAFTTAFRPIQKSIEECVRTGLDRDPKLWGRMALLLYLDNHGRVARATEHESHFPDPSVVKCSVDAAQTLWLPNATKGGLHLIALRVGAMPPIVSESINEPPEPVQEPRYPSDQLPSN